MLYIKCHKNLYWLIFFDLLVYFLNSSSQFSLRIEIIYISDGICAHVIFKIFNENVYFLVLCYQKIFHIFNTAFNVFKTQNPHTCPANAPLQTYTFAFIVIFIWDKSRKLFKMAFKMCMYFLLSFVKRFQTDGNFYFSIRILKYNPAFTHIHD